MRVLAALAVLVGSALLAAPAASAYPAGVVPTAEIDKTLFAPGETVVVTVHRTTPGPLTMQIFSAPVTIGTGTVGADAEGSVSGVVPPGYSGPHTIQVEGAGGEIFVFPITVVTGGGGGSIGYALVPGCRHEAHGSGVGSLRVTIAAATTTPGTYTVRLDPGAVTRTVVVDRQDRSVLFDDLASASYTVTVGVAGSPGGSSTPVTVRCRPLGEPGSANPGTTVAVGRPTTTGDLASTGTAVGVGVGLGTGLAALLGGALVLAASRRRGARH